MGLLTVGFVRSNAEMKLILEHFITMTPDGTLDDLNEMVQRSQEHVKRFSPAGVDASAVDDVSRALQGMGLHHARAKV